MTDQFERWINEVEKKNNWTGEGIKELGLLLAEETGEVMQLINKLTGTRQGHPDEPTIGKTELAAEVGDIYFVATRIAKYYGLTTDDCLRALQMKMFDRFGCMPYDTRVYIEIQDEKWEG